MRTGHMGVAISVVASVISLSAQKQTLTNRDKADAVGLGVKVTTISPSPVDGFISPQRGLRKAQPFERPRE
jgi:hypothetical protein